MGRWEGGWPDRTEEDCVVVACVWCTQRLVHSPELVELSTLLQFARVLAALYSACVSGRALHADGHHSVLSDPQVQFRTEIYGTFRQSVVFDFGTRPILMRQLCVESAPISDVEKIQQDLVLSDSGRWDLASKTIVPFSARCVRAADPWVTPRAQRTRTPRSQQQNDSACM